MHFYLRKCNSVKSRFVKFYILAAMTLKVKGYVCDDAV